MQKKMQKKNAKKKKKTNWKAWNRPETKTWKQFRNLALRRQAFVQYSQPTDWQILPCYADFVDLTPLWMQTPALHHLPHFIHQYSSSNINTLHIHMQIYPECFTKLQKQKQKKQKISQIIETNNFLHCKWDVTYFE